MLGARFADVSTSRPIELQFYHKLGGYSRGS